MRVGRNEPHGLNTVTTVTTIARIIGGAGGVINSAEILGIFLNINPISEHQTASLIRLIQTKVKPYYLLALIGKEKGKRKRKMLRKYFENLF